MIVVTGGAGFIGSNLVAALEARKMPLAVVDRLGHEQKWRNLAKRELAAIVAPEKIFEFLGDHAGSIEAIFHLGAISTTTATDADLVIETNFALSQQIWRWCADHAVRLIYASSAATYGDGGNGFDDDSSPEYLARLRPLNAYGWSKHLFDRWVARRLEASERRPPQIAGLKFFNVYGPNEYHKGTQRSVAHQIFEQAAGGGHANLFRSYRGDYADGAQLRDFVWVGDVVDMMMWLYDQRGVSGLFNAGSGAARSFIALAEAVYAAMNLPADIRMIEMPPNLRAQYQYHTEARMARLAAAGYSGQPTSLEDGVRQYVTQFLLADDPYR